MDPITLALIAMAVGYVTASPDQHTLRATRGTAGAVRSAGRAAAVHARSEWSAGGPARAHKRSARRTKWRTGNPVQRAGYAGEWGLTYMARAVRGLARTGAAAVRATPDGYRTAAVRAVEKRQQKRHRGPGWEPAELADLISTDPRPDADPDDPVQWANPPRVDQDGNRAAGPDLNPTEGDPMIELPDTALRYGAPADARAPYCPACNTRNWTANGACGTCTGAPNPAAHRGRQSGPGGFYGPPSQSVPSGADYAPTQETAPMDRTTMPTTELQTLAELDQEAVAADQNAAGAFDAVKDLEDWATQLLERFASAPFGTDALAKAVAAVSEAAPSSAQLQNLGEAVSVLRAAVAEAEAVGEAVDAHKATGRTEAFASA